MNVASGIYKVECFTGQFNNCMLCSEADEYDAKRDELLSEIITELSRFSFIWSSFEAIIDDYAQEKFISKKVVKKQGKVNAACCYLKIGYTASPLLYYYETLIDLENKIKKSSNYADVFNKFSPNQEWINQSGMGLYIVSKIRNKFAHGDHEFIEPEEWSGEKSLDKNIIMNSSRLLLFSMQMLLIAHYKDFEEIDCWWDYSIPKNEDSNREIEIKDYLKKMHLVTA